MFKLKFSQKNKYIIYITIAVIVSIFAAILPFILKTEKDTLISVIGVSFTAVAAVAGIATLIIAFLLYDRFGLGGKFIERQTDKVLELFTFLNEHKVTIHTESLHYFINPSTLLPLYLKDLLNYEHDKKKIILLNNKDYDAFIKPLSLIKNSYWLPLNIKDKISFLEIYGTATIEDAIDTKYVKLDFNAHPNNDDKWMRTLPEITFETYVIKFVELLKEIEGFLLKHSKIPINLRFK
jgi:hypothetical protein